MTLAILAFCIGKITVSVVPMPGGPAYCRYPSHLIQAKQHNLAAGVTTAHQARSGLAVPAHHLLHQQTDQTHLHTGARQPH